MIMRRGIWRSQRRPTIPRSNAESGFTLLEMVVAIAILSGSFVLVFGTFAWSLRAAQDLPIAIAARSLAQSLVAEASADDGSSPKSSKGVTESGLSWDVEIRPYRTTAEPKDVDAAAITATVHWRMRTGEKSVSLATLILVPRNPLP